MPSKKTPAPVPAPEKSKKKWSTTPFVWALFALLIFQSIQLMNLKQRVDDLSPGPEEGSSLSDIFGNDEEEGTALSTLLFDFVDNLGAYEANKALYEGNLTALQSAMQDGYWNGQGLSLLKTDGNFTEADLDYVFLDTASTNASILTVSLAYDGTLSVYPYGSELNLTDDTSVESSVADIKEYLNNDLASLRDTVGRVNAMRSDFSGWLNVPDVQGILTQNALTVLPELEQNESYLFTFNNPEGAAVAECRVLKADATLSCSSLSPELEVSGPVLADIKEDLKGLFGQVDTRTALQKTVDEQKAQLEEVISDPAFKAALDNAGLVIGAPTETDATVQYTLSTASGEVLRLLILDKSTGEVRVTLPDGQESQSLAAAVQLLEFSSKKKLWTSPVSSRTMLSSSTTLLI